MEYVERTAPFELRSQTGDGLTLSGYAAVFNRSTRIQGEYHPKAPNGVFDEQIAPGAFRRSIQSRTPVLMFDHGKHPVVGPMPLGRIETLREDGDGLWVEARLHDNWMIQPVRDAIASGAVDGMSFRFQVPSGKDTWDTTGDIPQRTVHEARTIELGPVVFPAYADTSVAVRSILGALPTVVDLDDIITDLYRQDPSASDTPDLAAPPDPHRIEHSGSTNGERAAFLRNLQLPRSV